MKWPIANQSILLSLSSKLGGKEVSPLPAFCSQLRAFSCVGGRRPRDGSKQGSAQSFPGLGPSQPDPSPRGRTHAAWPASDGSPGRWFVPAPPAVPALLTRVAHRPCRHYFQIAEESVSFTFLCFFSSLLPGLTHRPVEKGKAWLFVLGGRTATLFFQARGLACQK